jgi:hypothetical protein
VGGGIFSSSILVLILCFLIRKELRAATLIFPEIHKGELCSGVHRYHLVKVGFPLSPHLEDGSNLIVGGAPCLNERLTGFISFIACVLLREGARGCLLSLIWGGLCAVRLISLCLILSVFSLRGNAAYHLFTGPDWPTSQGGDLVSGNTGSRVAGQW